jgi:hypothetical protein
MRIGNGVVADQAGKESKPGFKTIRVFVAAP